MTFIHSIVVYMRRKRAFLQRETQKTKNKIKEIGFCGKRITKLKENYF